MPRRPPSSRRRSSTASAAEPASGAVVRASLALIRAYRLIVAPVLSPACRFAPSCSAFAAEAIARHGARRGLAMALHRLARCHPWRPGGYDPVPSTRG